MKIVHLVVFTGHAAVRYSDGIIYVKYLHGVTVTAETATTNKAAVESLMKGRKYPLLMDVSGIRGMSQDAKDLFKTAKGKDLPFSACAILIKSLFGVLIGRFYLVGSIPPVKIFISEKRAVRWLRDQVRTRPTGKAIKEKVPPHVPTNGTPQPVA